MEPSNASSPALAHERLDAYRAAVDLDALVVRLCRRAPRGHAWLLDQAQRAAGSAVLNLVEANGRTGGDRLQQLKVAKGSALELDAAVQLMEHRGMARAEDRARAHELVVKIVQMLGGMCRAQ